jgi:hypothetical protein|mmetsp:Transcript_11904/g.21918  ORF Transcript_11904/g.21918 Transcript_11904/m.21918 type:complete len:132 (+) Transcript_11904:1238-1633(+)
MHALVHTAAHTLRITTDENIGSRYLIMDLAILTRKIDRYINMTKIGQREKQIEGNDAGAMQKLGHQKGCTCRLQWGSGSNITVCLGWSHPLGSFHGYPLNWAAAAHNKQRCLLPVERCTQLQEQQQQHQQQ